jgi:hypothetical protein
MRIQRGSRWIEQVTFISKSWEFFRRMKSCDHARKRYEQAVFFS